MIVSVAVAGEPKVALLGLLSVKLTVSSTSLRLSSMIGTVKVRLVCPGLKVNVPLVAV